MYCGGNWRHKKDDMNPMKESICIVGKYEPMRVDKKCVTVSLHKLYRCPECKVEVFSDTSTLLGEFTLEEVRNGDEEELTNKCDFFVNKTAYREAASEYRDARIKAMDAHNHVKED